MKKSRSRIFYLRPAVQGRYLIGHIAAVRENLAPEVTVFVVTGEVASVKSFCSLVLLPMWYHLEKILIFVHRARWSV